MAAEGAVDREELSLQHSAELRPGKHEADTLLNTGSLKGATRLDYSQICGPGGIFVMFSSAVGDGLSVKDANAEHVRCFPGFP